MPKIISFIFIAGFGALALGLGLGPWALPALGGLGLALGYGVAYGL